MCDVHQQHQNKFLVCVKKKTYLAIKTLSDSDSDSEIQAGVPNSGVPKIRSKSQEQTLE